MSTWAEVEQYFDKHKVEFDRIYKCLNKPTNKLPKEEIVDTHVENIIIEYNSIVQYYIDNSLNWKPDHLHIYKTNILSLRDRLNVLFTRLKVNVAIPLSLTLIDNLVQNPNFDDTILDTDSDNDSNSDIMTQEAKDKFLTSYSRMVPEFDGSHENLTRFIDALELLDDNKQTFEASAIRLIKTRLIGTARSHITNETTIQAIITTLKNNVHPESTKVISAKLMCYKQGNKNAHNYMKEVENITNSLKKAYLTEGVSAANSFSRMMSLAFAGASQVQFFLYLDDVIVIGNSIKHHLKNLEEVF